MNQPFLVSSVIRILFAEPFGGQNSVERKQASIFTNANVVGFVIIV